MKLKTLKAGIVPHKFPWSPTSPVSKRERDERMEARKRRKMDKINYTFRDVGATQEIQFVEHEGTLRMLLSCTFT